MQPVINFKVSLPFDPNMVEVMASLLQCPVYKSTDIKSLERFFSTNKFSFCFR